ncbi:ABC transporter substrate-binding protein [Actinophytocola oryzae]|uniref:NitT/TauT family transport system substrate-binding protein n=1 Tax=Actinophytocola oryzae TaxID=502181 RepID=A0A4R7UU99_9PSEU|nr:ABC transporter substrate-binding protein [Actinophytocola oryzae]TDV38647.1 NitT/TauT family transport system substrate-binding protein [Actinophytocola oryzae]
MRTRLLLATTVALSLLAAACSRADSGSTESDTPAKDTSPATELRLGYFPNVTHAPALIGLDKGLFEKELGKTKLTRQEFNAGPNEVSALLGGSLDIGFIGSGPAINAYAKSNGEAVRLISGVTSGGAQFVTTPDIARPEDLVGKTVVTPQLGNTQDVSLKKWLADKKLTGKVQVTNMDNAQTLDAFKGGQVQAAWLPEPWSSRLVLEAGAKVLVDEKELWPDGQFPTTVLVVRTQFLEEHPQTVRAFLKGLVASIDYANDNAADAQAAVNKQLETLTGKALKPETIERAWSNITLTFDPIAGEFKQLAQDQVIAGIAKEAPDVAGFANLTELNAVLEDAGQPEVDAGGLDKK